MTQDDMLFMEEPKRKLRNIRDYMFEPECTDFMCDLVALFADHLNPEIAAQGVVLALYQFIDTIHKDAFSCAVMLGLFPNITKAVFPADFADKVISRFHEFNSTQV